MRMFESCIHCSASVRPPREAERLEGVSFCSSGIVRFPVAVGLRDTAKILRAMVVLYKVLHSQKNSTGEGKSPSRQSLHRGYLVGASSIHDTSLAQLGE